MKKIAQFDLERGGSVLVEVIQTRREEKEELCGGEELVEKAAITLEKAISNIAPVAESIVSQMWKIRPDEIGIELGVSFDIDGNIIIGSVSAGASITLSLTWNGSGTNHSSLPDHQKLANVSEENEKICN